MRNTGQVMSKNDQYANEGSTLLELIIVIAILSILAAVTFPSIVGYLEMTNERVCNFNRLELEKTYNTYLEIENIQHTDSVFTKFLVGNDVICPRHGEISYKEGNFECEIHLNRDQDEGNDEEVPYL